MKLPTLILLCGPLLALRALAGEAAPNTAAAAPTPAANTPATPAATAPALPPATPPPAPAATAPALPPAPPPVASALAAGPMVAYVDMREAAVWVQTAAPGTVTLEYWASNQPETRFTSAPVVTRTEEACVATLIADQVRPGTRYTYQVLVNGAPAALAHPAGFATLPSWLEAGTPPDFSIAFVSGFFVYDPAFDPAQFVPPEGALNIVSALRAKQPDAVVWLGGTTWLREADWGSRTGYLRRHAQTRAMPQLQPLLATTPQYAAMGGPEFGPPGADALWSNLRAAQESFRLFWPATARGAARLDGLVSTFRFGDAEFFLLDNRSYHNLGEDNVGARVMLGAEQFAWLAAALRQSRATFKIVCASSPLLHPVSDASNLAAAPEDRNALIALLRNPALRGVIFVTGGKPYGEVSRLDRSQQGYPLFDLTVGPFTARPVDVAGDPNFLRVPNSARPSRQFALLRFHGLAAQRLITLALFDPVGEELLSLTLSAADLGWAGM